MHRRGWATSEFWTALAVGVGSLAASIAGYLPPRYASIASAVAVGCYAIGRGLAKGGFGGTVPTAPAGPQAAAPSGPPADNAGALDTVTAPPVGVK